MLFIVDHIPTEDMGRKELFSGSVGKLFFNMMNRVKDNIKKDCTVYVVPYNVCKTYDLSGDLKEIADTLCQGRVKRIVSKLKPDMVITCGLEPNVALSGSPQEARKFLGQVRPVKIGRTEYNVMSTLSISTLYGDVEAKFKETVKVSELIGMWIRHVSWCINGTTPKIKLDKGDYKYIYIDTMRKVKLLLAKLRKADIVCIDTEGSGLYRRASTLFSIQFGLGSTAYFVPLYHKDTPFTPTQLEKVRKAICHYLETNDNKYHIMHNAKFDTGQVLNLGVRYYKAPVYCTTAGEYALDENRTALTSFGYSAYSLAALCNQYGSDIYSTLQFSKADRVTIATTDLNDALIEYACVDVIAPRLIHDEQLKQADEDHIPVVTRVIGSLIHCFAVMEYFGLPVDKEWVHYLKTPESPVNKIIKEMKDSFRKSDNVKKANALLVKKSGAPSNGLFGASVPHVFDIGKDAHKQVLFFGVLKLEPLGRNAKGGGKLDKAFKSHYSSKVEEVRWLEELGKAEKLRSSYVNKFYDVLRDDPDARLDSRIRPQFSFTDVVTGRASAKDPSLHQIPSRSELGKVIKRMFVAEKGNMFCAADYSAHEIRGFTLIAKDKVFAEQFAKGLFARLNYRLNPTPENERAIELYGDVHKLNVQFFHNTHPDDCTKEARNAVKVTTFGTLYGMGVQSLSDNIGQPLSATKKLLKQFFGKFFASKKWLDAVQAFAKKNLYARSPLGRKRHLFGFLHPDTGIQAANARMSMNSPIQGTASDQGFIGGREFQTNVFKWTSSGCDLKIQISNSVHDSVYSQCPFWAIPVMAYIMEHSYTTGVHRVCRDEFNAPLPVGLEMDFEFGDNLRDVKGWDFVPESLVTLVSSSLIEQETRMGIRCTNKKAVLNAVQHNSRIFGKVRLQEVAQQLEADESVNYHMKMDTLLSKMVARVRIVEANFVDVD